jgi:hypothetical protein
MQDLIGTNPSEAHAVKDIAEFPALEETFFNSPHNQEQVDGDQKDFDTFMQIIAQTYTEDPV